MEKIISVQMLTGAQDLIDDVYKLFYEVKSARYECLTTCNKAKVNNEARYDFLVSRNHQCRLPTSFTSNVVT